MSTKLTLGNNFLEQILGELFWEYYATIYYFFPFIFISLNDTDHNCLFTLHWMNWHLKAWLSLQYASVQESKKPSFINNTSDAWISFTPMT